MFEFLHRRIPYTYNYRNQILIALILGFLVAFIMIFLGPFDTDRFESDHKYLILSGFGFLFSILYFIYARIENLCYTCQNQKWVVKYEIASFLSFLFIASIPIHFYNQVFLNNLFKHEFYGYEYLKHWLWFFGYSIVPVMFILLPFYLYFRNKFGVLITSETLNEVAFYGLNNEEKIVIQKESLLYVQASENYVKIFYKQGDGLKHKTIRNTLKAIKKQAPFLNQCHRSYVVNVTNIKMVNGNSQNASIAFHDDKLRIPLSKSYYKTIKSTVSI
jgi:hypothetical protein